MKTGAKLIMLLAVLAICMPAQGEFLIYKVNGRDKGAESNGSDEIFTDSSRSYLIIEVVYEDGVIVDMNPQAYTVEYWREGRDKFWEVNEDLDELVIQRFDDGRRVLYSLANVNEIEGSYVFFASLLHGRAQTPRVFDGVEVPMTLSGYTLENIVGDESTIIKVNCRLENRGTRDINEDPEVETIEDAVDAVINHLEDDLGYVEYEEIM